MSWIIDTDRIKVRPIELSDAGIFFKWWNDGNLMKDVGFKEGLKISLNRIEQSFIKRLSQSIPTLFIIYDQKSNLPIGELSFGELNVDEGTCRIGMKICDVNSQGMGYGHHSLCEFLKYLFNHFNLKIINIDTLMSNTRAINLYKKIGSEVMEIKKGFWTDPEGILRDAIFFKLDRNIFFNYYK